MQGVGATRRADERLENKNGKRAYSQSKRRFDGIGRFRYVDTSTFLDRTEQDRTSLRVGNFLSVAGRELLILLDR